MKKEDKKNLFVKKQVVRKKKEVVKKINESLKRSVREGSYASGLSGFGISYFTPYALALNASSSQIGFLSSLASLFPSIVQLKSLKLIEKFSRKKIAVISALLQNLMLIFIILAGVLFYFNVPYTVWILILFIALFYGFGAVTHPAWFSWMGSLVPEKTRGRYFSRRNRITGFFGLLTMILGAVLLDFSRKFGFVLLGFGILFSLAFILRLISIKLLSRQYEPKLKIHKKDYFSLWQFLKKAPETPFGRFTIFISFMRIAINIAGPFWAVYMLKDLAFPYIWFMLITVSGVISQLIFYPLIGKFSDRFGNVLLLRVSTSIMFIIPALWIIAPYMGLSMFGMKIYLLTIPQIIGGFAWAGYYLATNNYIYDSVKKEKRSYGLAYFNLLNGLGMFIGAGIGGLIALADIFFMNKLLFIFMISGIARFFVAIIGSRFLREVRHVKEFSSQFIIKEFQPVKGLVKEVHNLRSFKM
jgi:MFS family permease